MIARSRRNLPETKVAAALDFVDAEIGFETAAANPGA